MGLLSSFTTKNDGDDITAELWNANFSAIDTWADTYVVHTDVAKTITVTHIYTQTQTFTGGWTAGAAVTVSTGGLTVTAGGITVVAGTTAVQALTATTGAFSSTLSVTGLVTVAAGLTSTSGSSLTLVADGVAAVDFWTDGASRIKIAAAGHLIPTTDAAVNIGASGTNRFANLYMSGGIVCATVNTSGDFVCGGATQTTTLVVSGAATMSTINGQTISATASFTGTVTVGTGLTVTAGTSALQAVTATTINASGTTTLAGLVQSGAGSIALTGNISATGQIFTAGTFDAGATNDAGTLTLDWDNGNVQRFVVNNTETLGTPANPKDGAIYYLMLTYASGTLTWFGSLTWAVAPPPSVVDVYLVRLVFITGTGYLASYETY